MPTSNIQIVQSTEVTSEQLFHPASQFSGLEATVTTDVVPATARGGSATQVRARQHRLPSLRQNPQT